MTRWLLDSPLGQIVLVGFVVTLAAALFGYAIAVLA